MDHLFQLIAAATRGGGNTNTGPPPSKLSKKEQKALVAVLAEMMPGPSGVYRAIFGPEDRPPAATSVALTRPYKKKMPYRKKSYGRKKAYGRKKFYGRKKAYGKRTYGRKRTGKQSSTLYTIAKALKAHAM